MLVVRRVAVRHDRVQPVVPAEPLEDDEDAAGVGGRGGATRLREQRGHRADAADEAESDAAGANPEHVAARDAAVCQSAAHSGPPPKSTKSLRPPDGGAPRISPLRAAHNSFTGT